MQAIADPTRGVMRLAIVGPGRLGSAIATRLRPHPSFELTGPLGRDETGARTGNGATTRDSADALSHSDAVLVCVPDREIAAAASAIRPGPIVGHCSGATGLEPLEPHERFSLHPLMTVSDAGANLAGATAAVEASSQRASTVAMLIAAALELDVVELKAEDRPAYHAAASIASNFLVTLEAAAERLAATVGISRSMLAPLVRATVENWAALGPERALTGPVARGDEQTIAVQRSAVAQRTPELLPLFDALTEATRSLAAVR